MIHEDYIRAGAPTTTQETLCDLSFSNITTVRRRVAENPRAPEEILLWLSNDPDPEIRIAVGLNKATPISVVKQLLYDECVDVRYALAETSYLPKEILRFLTTDDNSYVANRAARTMFAVYSPGIYYVAERKPLLSCA